jgi:phosphoglycerate dehydrogenase-like enzyme
MKALIIGSRERFEKFMPDNEFVRNVRKTYVELDTPPEQYSKDALECDVIAADSIASVPGELIRRMPNLRLIHAEGVGYNGFDTKAAAESGIAICNNKGVNASAVAEQAILLMLGLLRNVVPGNTAVLTGGQIAMKEHMMVHGITELSQCRIGLIGFGDIAKALSVRLHAFGCQVFYNTRSRKSPDIEEACHATWLPMDELLATCDIISLHVPACGETNGMVNDGFLGSMKPSSYLVNTARGELVDNDALCRALTSGHLAGAALDTVAPEPVLTDNPLVCLPDDIRSRVLFSPHVGGITTATFLKAHAGIWDNIQRLAEGRELRNRI